jgi:hypothetical protein
VFAGPSLPKATYAAAIVTTPDGTGVVLIGGINTPNDLYELKCSSNFCKWSLMEQKLLYDRVVFPVAMYVPDSFADCETGPIDTTTTKTTTTGTYRQPF